MKFIGIYLVSCWQIGASLTAFADDFSIDHTLPVGIYLGISDGKRLVLSPRAEEQPAELKSNEENLRAAEILRLERIYAAESARNAALTRQIEKKQKQLVALKKQVAAHRLFLNNQKDLVIQLRQILDPGDPQRLNPKKGPLGKTEAW